MVTPAPRHGPIRAAHADREQVVDALKAAFVQGRLTQDELDARVGQALAARTYADLAALTTDLPAEPDRTPADVPAPTPLPARPRNQAATRAVKSGVGAITALSLGVAMALVAAGHPQLGAVLAVAIMFFATVVSAFVASLIAVTVKLESLHRNRSRRRLPGGPASGQGGLSDQASPGSRASEPRRPHRHGPPGSLALGRAS